MRKSLLFADNDPDFLDTRSEELERAGFEVLKASSVEQAEQILQDKYVHLLITDLRLRDDSDDRDTTGLTLAKKKAYHSIPKIILTRFPGYEHVREALGPALNALPPAVDFVAKQEGPKVLVQSVNDAFTKYVRINWNLTIRCGAQLSFFHLVDQITPEIDRVQLSDRADELEDLFRCLFYDSSQVTISRLLTWREKRVILVVFAFSKEGIESQYVVSCGYKQDIQAEEDHYQTFVPKGGGRGSTVRFKSAETPHFAATAYLLTDGVLGETTTLTQFYRDSPAEMVMQALSQLFASTLAPWYKTGRFREEEQTLAELVIEWPGLSKTTLSPAILEPRLESLCKECLSAGLAQLDYSPHQLTLHLSGRTPLSYPNPISCLSEARQVLNPPFLCGTIHGQLDGDSILIDRQARTWLIDFSQTGQGPLLRDFVSLESAIKLELLSTTNVQTRYELEKRLTALSSLDVEIDIADLESEAQKALRAIQCIRHHASSVMGGELESYLGGLLFCAAGYLADYDPTLRHTRQELIPYLHSLLSAAILCQRLAPAPRQDVPAQALNSLWIDALNKEVWVEGRKLALSPQEFDLLKYLYDHQNKLCARSDIAQQVFDVSYGPGTSDREKKSVEESRLNSTMSRLRRKIEPNPSYPKYIIAIRGEGYRLEL